MKNKIIVEDIIINEKKAIYKFNVYGNCRKYFRIKRVFFIEYDFNISQIPKSVMIVPFLCNILPITWLCDAEISVNDIDEDFYKSLLRIKEGFQGMYPMLDFKGKLISNSIKRNSNTKRGNTAMFFSGGIDSFATLVLKRSDNPDLITIWGSDLSFSDIGGWNHLKELIENTASQFKLQNTFVTSSFRRIVDYRKLNTLVKKSKDNWWHGFHHGLGIIGHAAPYAYEKNISDIYISSTYSDCFDMNITCASDPKIDNKVEFCSCKVSHIGFELSRQDKYTIIINYYHKIKKEINVQVCWVSKTGSNCCNCEKCYRTIFGIMAEGYDPKEAGFLYNNTDIKKMIKDIKNKIILDSITTCFWKEIRNTYIRNRNGIRNENLDWLADMDFTKIVYENKSYLNKIYLKVILALRIIRYRN